MNIIEYEKSYLEDVKNLLVELEEYIISIDKDNLDQVHPEYRDKMAVIDLEKINNILNESKENKELEGMGTTLEVCLIYNNRVYIGHVGDSRIYRIRKEFIRKLTVDHSYVQQLVKDGTITKEEAEKHPKKNMLMKALGCTAYVEPDVMVKGFIKDDILLMSSDGLTNMLKDEEIYNIIKENPELASEKLVQKANELGGYDNITVVIIL